MTFVELGIIEPILKALKQEEYVSPTPIQEMTIPPLLIGRDLLGCAQTGTGKTASFAIPILQKLYEQEPVFPRKIQALILTPTRELAAQIGDSFETYGSFVGLKSRVIFGGVSQNPQVEAIKRGIDILVATPGRLLDLMNQHIVDIHHVKYFVLDEADHMLDMGFIHDVKKIIAKLPARRQTMLFSATMPPEITKLVNSILIDPVKVSVTPDSPTVDLIEQSLYFVSKGNKKKLLPHLLKSLDVESALVFSRTKHGANKIAKDLLVEGIVAEVIHGNKSQNARQLALHNFKTKKTKIMIATDIAARGLDIDKLSHVFNYDLPEVPEAYVHRIGRTGRAGLGGIAISFCALEEKKLLKDIQKLIGKEVPVIEDNPWPILDTDPIEKLETRGSFARGGGGGGGGGSAGGARQNSRPRPNNRRRPQPRSKSK
ncbi:MAG: DEAD/DEAH box helicase [Bacillota bacterium]